MTTTTSTTLTLLEPRAQKPSYTSLAPRSVRTTLITSVASAPDEHELTLTLTLTLTQGVGAGRRRARVFRQVARQLDQGDGYSARRT